ncbi:MAG: glutamate--tRNA ligase [Caulobacterales bacterium]|uniref:glutamate--tRNA ligase n=1 Tax=Glycocaulis sp. TaxID=1969725 RepID=UPI003F9FDD2D
MQNRPGIITRFAPSPTGFLHIGGARTALFNYLFARKMGGQFKLRIEDTDRERSTTEAVDAILDGLRWLGLDWDGNAISQFAQADRHREVAQELIDQGKAFRCYCTPEEVEALRAEAFAQGRALRSPWRDGGTPPEDRRFTVRFRAPDSDVVLSDAVQGEVRWAAKEFDDLILLRADGNPTYNLAVVVDDHDMGVTHIIRGDDHLVNGGRQAQLYDALGWDRPVFAHIPLIHGPDGKKLSKRHGALGAEAYRDMGYLPEGLRNYLARLGWSHGDQELFSDSELVEAFSLDGLNKAPARLDFDKMAFVNHHHMRLADNDRLLTLLTARLEGQDGLVDGAVANARLTPAMDMLKERSKTLAEMEVQAYFLLRQRPFELDDAAAKHVVPETIERLARLRTVLAGLGDWTAEGIGEALKAFAESESVGFGKVGQPLRAVMTGGAPAPDMSLVLALLGRDETLARLDDQTRPA